MHELLCRLRQDPRISVTWVHDVGNFLYVGVWHEGEPAALVVPKRNPLHVGDLSLIRGGQPEHVPGGDASEWIRYVVDRLKAVPFQPGTRGGTS